MRSRTIKPEFWSDEKLASVSRELRLFFVGLWSVSDDYGVAKAHPFFLKNQLFPYDNLKISHVENWIKELERMNRISVFNYHDEKFLYIHNFQKYQHVDHPSKVRNPEVPKDTLASVSRAYPMDSRVYRDETDTDTDTDTSMAAGQSVSVDKSVKNFNEFWTAYPRKEKKKASFAAWKKLKINETEFKSLMESLINQKTSEQWNKNSGQYIPHPTTWLNGRRWEDEINTIVKTALKPELSECKQNIVRFTDGKYACDCKGRCPNTRTENCLEKQAILEIKAEKGIA